MLVLRDMENCGALLDVEILQAQSEILGSRLKELESEAQNLAGRPFNLASTKQLQEVLFSELKLPVIKKTPEGRSLNKRGGTTRSCVGLSFTEAAAGAPQFIKAERHIY